MGWAPGERTGDNGLLTKRPSTVLNEGNDELDERRSLIRQVRQRLESLRRAGLVQISAPGSRQPADAKSPSRDPGPRARVESLPGEMPMAASEIERAAELSSLPPAAPPPAVSPAAPRRPPPQPRVPSAGSAASVSSLFDESGFDAPPVPVDDRPAILAAAAAEVARCTRCPHLAATRAQ